MKIAFHATEVRAFVGLVNKTSAMLVQKVLSAKLPPKVAASITAGVKKLDAKELLSPETAIFGPITIDTSASHVAVTIDPEYIIDCIHSAGNSMSALLNASIAIVKYTIISNEESEKVHKKWYPEPEAEIMATVVDPVEQPTEGPVVTQ